MPSPRDWRQFVSALLLWLGALLFAAGVVFFFAYNWEALGRFAKFGLVEALLVAAVAGAWLAGPDKATGKALLFLASVLAGALLALIGQTYQTGADTFELFAWWAVLILPWTVVSRTPAQWMLLVVLLNLGVGFYYDASRRAFGFLISQATVVWALTILNASILVAWEYAASRGAVWLQDRWPARILMAIAGTAVTFLALWGIFESSEVGPFAIPAYLLWVGGLYFVYRHRVRDLFALAGGVLSVIVFVATLLGKQLIRHADAGGFLIIGVLVIAMSAGGAWWIKTIASEGGERE